MISLPAPAESLCFVHMAAEQAAGGSNEQLFLYIGLTNGVCQRVRLSCLEKVERSVDPSRRPEDVLAIQSFLVHSINAPCLIGGLVLLQVAVDATAGTLSDARQRFLGSRAVKLFRINVQNIRGVS